MTMMRVSQMVTKTAKQAPADEVAKNAQLLIRAGYVYKVMAGVYAYTPLGLRVLENIKQIIREEINAIGGQELIMSSLQRRETWEVTGRWDDELVDIWFKSALKDGTEVGFGWSHEEAVIEMLKTYLSSYKDLPMNVYQFQTKLRNELRAKSGIMRGREFIMKDMYSCSVDADQHEAFYQACIAAYKQVFDRLGIGAETYVTFASGGAFTRYSHEFQTLCDAGEDVIYLVPGSGQAYNEEVAPSRAAPFDQSGVEPAPLQEVEGQGITGVSALAKQLGVPEEQTTKTMLYSSGDGQTLVAAVVRGDYEVNEEKLKAVSNIAGLRLATPEQIVQATGAETGYAGLLHLPKDIQLFVDDSCQSLVNFETGCNRTGYHARNVNWERDVPRPAGFHDIKLAHPGDIHPDTGEVYQVHKTAEVGNIFNFGLQKSKDTGFAFTDAAGKRQYVHLGSYGIGVTRLMGVLAEKLSDARGLVWPDAVAPYRLVVVQVGVDEAVSIEAVKLCEIAQSWGVEVLYDDRAEARPGEKFADADLLGIPHRVVISNKTIAAGTYEYKRRPESESQQVSPEALKKLLTSTA